MMGEECQRCMELEDTIEVLERQLAEAEREIQYLGSRASEAEYERDSREPGGW